MSRAQSHVVGVALMLAVAVVAVGGLTAVVGSLVDGQTANADATRVADGMDDALRPLSTTGPHTGRVQFASGQLGTAERDLRVLENGSVVASVPVDALVFESADRRVAYVAGAVVRGRPDNAWFRTDPPVSGSERNGVLVVSAPRLGADGDSVAGTGSAAVTLRTNVSHDRRSLGTGRYTVAIETATPGPFVRHFRARNATVGRRDLDGDGTPSVVATFPGQRRAYLAVHDLSLEVADG
jgi:hypothetical protein